VERAQPPAANAALTPPVRAALLLVLLALAALPTAACTPVDAAPARSAPDADSAVAAASALLDRLAVRAERDATSYRRAAFGRRWAEAGT
jgi:hypothetical protein